MLDYEMKQEKTITILTKPNVTNEKKCFIDCFDDAGHHFRLY